MRLFLVKVYYASVVYSSNIYHEVIFSSLKDSVNFIKTCELDGMDEIDFYDWRKRFMYFDYCYSFRVYEVELGNIEEPLVEYEFTRLGEMIYKYVRSNGYMYQSDKTDYPIRDNEPNAGTLFNVGDIIIVKGETYGGLKRNLDYLAVVCSIPLSKEEFRGEEEWENYYLIYTIDDKGYLTHEHAHERFIEKVEDDKKLPVGVEFYKVLSQIFKGNIKLSEKSYNQLLYKDTYVINDLAVYEIPELSYLCRLNK